MRTMSGIALFALGFVAGVAATYKYWQSREKQRADDEIASVIDAFDKRIDKEATEKKIEELNTQSKEIMKEKGYTNYSSYSDKEPPVPLEQESRKEDDNVKNAARLITPDEYWEVVGYDKIPYTYYSDGVLADENDERVSEEEIEMNLVSDFREHFDDNSDDPDTVYIRNDDLSCDYEITRDYRPYSEVVGE